jgi:O-antigen ligase
MRLNFIKNLPRLSWAFFFATVVLLPFRYRLLQISRPIVPVWEDYTDFILYATDVTLLLALTTWFVHLYLTKIKLPVGPAFLFLPLAGLTLITIITSLTSLDPALSLYHAVRLTILFGLYLWTFNNVRSLQQLIAPFAIMVAIQSLIAIPQVLTQHSVGLQALGEFELDPAWSGVSVIWTNTMRSLRAYGLSDHPNILGGSLVFALILLLVFELSQPRMNPLMFSVVAVGLIATFFTYSRSAWLGLAGAATFVGYMRYAKPRTWPGKREIAFAAGLLLLLVPFVFSNLELVGLRLGEEISFEEIELESGSMSERRVLTNAGNTVFAEHAIFGVGIGATPQAFMRQWPDFPIDYAPVHNVLFSAALETGLIGALFYAMLLLAPWIALYHMRHKHFSRGLIASLAALLAFTVIGLFDVHPWLVAAGRLLQYLGWGLFARFYADVTVN